MSHILIYFIVKVVQRLKPCLLLASQEIEESISASHNTALGDKGNPQVTKELNQLGKVAVDLNLS